MGVLTDTLRATLRDLAASDARLYRGLAQERELRRLLARAVAELTTSSPDEIQAAIRLLEANGYEVQKR
jgi:hypothetical protein